VLTERCLGSECHTDIDCGPEMMCRAVASLGGLPVRLCLLAGELKEGEICFDLPRTRGAACEAGLICHHQYCGRPCRMDNPTTCSERFRCVDDLNGPVCVPSCLRTGCPEGQRCVLVEGEAAICGSVHGEARPAPTRFTRARWSPASRNAETVQGLRRVGDYPSATTSEALAAVRAR